MTGGDPDDRLYPPRGRPVSPAARRRVDLSLVIACYNEEPILAASMAEVFGVLDAWGGPSK